MPLVPMSREHAELIIDQADIKQRLTKAQADVFEVNAAIEEHGRRPQLVALRTEAVRVVIKLTRDLQAINAKVKTINIAQDTVELDARRKMHREARRGYIDEFDYKNQLHEPQDLLRRATAALERATARCSGRTPADRAILDAAQDYLRRHGIQI